MSAKRDARAISYGYQLPERVCATEQALSLAAVIAVVLPVQKLVCVGWELMVVQGSELRDPVKSKRCACCSQLCCLASIVACCSHFSCPKTCMCQLGVDGCTGLRVARSCNRQALCLLQSFVNAFGSLSI